MADVEFDRGGAAGRSFEGVQRVIHLAGALTSVALVAGLGWWGYQLAVRDVSGIPVVRAIEGPMRVAPADPGGEIASHLGLSVNAIAAEGEAVTPAEQLVLAPRPVDLAEEDLPAGALPAAPPLSRDAPAAAAADPNPSGILGVIEVAGAPFTPTAPVEMPTETPLAAPAEARVDVGGDALALVVGTKGAEPGAADLPVPAGEPIVLDGLIEPATDDSLATLPEAVAETDLPQEPAPPGALLRSPRPPARPFGGVVLASASATAPAPVAARTADPAAITPGTRLVQLGAFDDEAGAIAEWNRLTARFGGLVADKARVLQAAVSGGREFVRLRAMGFADAADARRFCAALLAENAACIPVAQR